MDSARTYGTARGSRDLLLCMWEGGGLCPARISSPKQPEGKKRLGPAVLFMPVSVLVVLLWLLVMVPLPICVHTCASCAGTMQVYVRLCLCTCGGMSTNTHPAKKKVFFSKLKQIHIVRNKKTNINHHLSSPLSQARHHPLAPGSFACPSGMHLPSALSHSFCSFLLPLPGVFCPFWNMFSQGGHRLC